MTKVLEWMKTNPFFIVAGLLAIVSVLLGDFSWSYINFQLLVTLFGLMLVLGLFSASGGLNYASFRLLAWANNSRDLIQALILLSFLASFLLSNDVAVLTLLPLYLNVLYYLPKFNGQVLGAVLIVLAANLGGVFFPFSNPQNLLIYQTFQPSFIDFITWTGPLMLVGLILLGLASFKVDKLAITKQKKTATVSWSLAAYASLGMGLMVLAIFGVLNVYWTAGAISLAVFIFGRKYFLQVDYMLLLTFACFFIIVGNLSRIFWLRELLATYASQLSISYWASLLLSQIFSNVPTTILLLPFSQDYPALLLGVNIGGLGTLLASMANLLGFNIVRSFVSMDTRAYLRIFLKVNFSFLIILSIIFYAALTLLVS